MGLTLSHIEVNLENKELLKSFISNLDEEKDSFRYFNKRDFTVLKSHIYTGLLLVKDTPVCYGHLDKDNGRVWLGIVVKKEFQGKGIAHEMMTLLLNKARSLGTPAIQLSVDISNRKAIKLYRKYGFKVIESNSEYLVLEKTLLHIGVSTLAFKGASKEEVVKSGLRNNWLIEFSSSFPFDEEMINFFNTTTVTRLAHNYFPAPKTEFVLNLASLNNQIRQKSIDHCIQGLEISKKAGCRVFSAHAGFCIDPDPEQLGKPLEVNISISRSSNWKLFLDSINQVLNVADTLDMTFLIENNVTAAFNLRKDNQEVLLCSTPEELIHLAKTIDSPNFGLLLDTAHLKVSSIALKFDLDLAVKKLVPYVKYIHHSDNDGAKDTNEIINEDYWFLPFMQEFKECIHILEVKDISNTIVQKQINILSE